MGLLGSVFGGFTGLAGNIIGAASTNKAIKKSAAAQAQATQLAIDENRRQFDTTRSDYMPFVTAGQGATRSISDLLGLGGGVNWQAYINNQPDVLNDFNTYHAGEDPSVYAAGHYARDGSRRDLTPYTTTAGQAQESALATLKASPLFKSLFNTGQEAVLANASATGGLRGGNAQTSLYQLGEDTLSRVIQQQLSNLGFLASQGSGAVGNLGQLGSRTAQTIGDLTQDKGTIQASSILGQQQVNNALQQQIQKMVASFIPGGGGKAALAGGF